MSREEPKMSGDFFKKYNFFKLLTVKYYGNLGKNRLCLDYGI